MGGYSQRGVDQRLQVLLCGNPTKFPPELVRGMVITS